MNNRINERGAESELAAANQEIAMLKRREQQLREALREMANRLPPVGQPIYGQVLKRAGLFDWISVR